MSTTHAVHGAPAGRSVKTATVSSTSKRVLIALGVATYLGATAAATVYGSAALYMLFHKQRPAGITAGLTLPQSAPSHAPWPLRAEVSLLPLMLARTFMFMAKARSLRKVAVPSPLDSGLVQVKETLTSLPARGER